MDTADGNTNDSSTARLLRRAEEGDQDALARLFDRYRDQLRRMIRLRLDPRLHGRVDASDVLQETYLDAYRRLGEFRSAKMSLFLWLRLLTGQKMIDLYRFHVGADKRTVSREVSLYRGALPEATSASLAAQLLGRMTSVSQAAMRAELKLQVQDALNAMEPLDREVLALRHFEALTNAETAEVLGIKPNAASNRYIRALKRIKLILSAASSVADQPSSIDRPPERTSL